MRQTTETRFCCGISLRGSHSYRRPCAQRVPFCSTRIVGGPATQQMSHPRNEMQHINRALQLPAPAQDQAICLRNRRCVSRIARRLEARSLAPSPNTPHPARASEFQTLPARRHAGEACSCRVPHRMSVPPNMAIYQGLYRHLLVDIQQVMQLFLPPGDGHPWFGRQPAPRSSTYSGSAISTAPRRSAPLVETWRGRGSRAAD
jgi:hypothetical protein